MSVMSAYVVLDASMTVPVGDRSLHVEPIVADAAIASALRSAIDILSSDGWEARAG
jgi:hypothetical protein